MKYYLTFCKFSLLVLLNFVKMLWMDPPPLSRSIVDCFVSGTPGCKQMRARITAAADSRWRHRSVFMIPFYSASSMKLKSYFTKYYVSSMSYMSMDKLLGIIVTNSYNIIKKLNTLFLNNLLIDRTSLNASLLTCERWRMSARSDS